MDLQMWRQARLKMSRADMDMQARASVLEGALGVPPWSMTRSTSAIYNAFAELPDRYPDMDPSWVSTRDLGVHDKVVQGAKSVLPHEVGSRSAEEIAQDMAAGLSPSGDPKEENVYTWMGKKYGKGILSGRVKPTGRFLSDLFKGAKNRALDTVDMLQRNKSRREKHSPSLIRTEEFGDQVSSQTAFQQSPLEVLLHLLSSPAANRVKNWIYKTLERKATPTQMAVIEAILESKGNLTNAQLGAHPKVVAVTGVPISGQMAGRHRDRAINIVKKDVARNPHRLDWIDKYLDLAELGFGGGSIRRAMIRRVAARYLQGSSSSP